MEPLFPQEQEKEEVILEEPMLAAQKPAAKGIRAEAVLGLIALFSLVLLIAMIVLCMPYFKSKEAPQEDPETLVRPQHAAVEEMLTNLEETEPIPEETEPTNPTIPPEANPYGRLDFQYNSSGYLRSLRQDSFSGVDVSAFQGNIDWQKVKDSGISFALIRMGYRGYESGKLVEDEYAQKNLEGATAVGMPIGIYFFSQALNTKEAQEEIDFMLKVLGEYEVQMPVILDWEIPAADARTAKMDARTLTDIQLYFCQTMEEKGYTPMIYFNWHQSNTLLYLSELERYPFWLALYSDRMNYPWKVDMWQYTCEGRVPGIPGNVDINVYMPDY